MGMKIHFDCRPTNIDSLEKNAPKLYNLSTRTSIIQTECAIAEIFFFTFTKKKMYNFPMGLRAKSSS